MYREATAENSLKISLTMLKNVKNFKQPIWYFEFKN